MPWDSSSFKSKHFHAATDAEAETASGIANKLLGEGKDEGTAIATGIKLAKAKHGGVGRTFRKNRSRAGNTKGVKVGSSK